MKTDAIAVDSREFGARTHDMLAYELCSRHTMGWLCGEHDEDEDEDGDTQCYVTRQCFI